MKISAKINYACRAILELSLQWPNKEPLQVQVIAKKQKIPIKFLIQILLHLKQVDIIKSIRGKKGGYLLNKAPKDIKLYDIVSYFDNSYVDSTEEEKENAEADVINDIWVEINKIVIGKFTAIDFEHICTLQRKADETVMFNI